MTTATVKTYATIDKANKMRNQIGKHIQEKKVTIKGSLARTIDFLFSCESDNPYNLSPAMKAKLYL